MLNQNYIYILYQFSPSSLDELNSEYKTILVFDDYGQLSEEKYKEFKTEKNDRFETIEDLKEYFSELLKRSDYSAALLLSTNDYNIGIESCHDLGAFREIFKRYGTEVEKLDDDSQGKGIFGRFF